MGWFWAAPSDSAQPAPLPRRSAAPATLPPPPPGCPMHIDSDPTSSFPPRRDSPETIPSSCPVKGTTIPSQRPRPDAEPLAQTIVPERSKYNPLNFMFSTISNSATDSQSIELSLERETSSIPRGDAASNWEYPSPQQMYNAMLRKGYTDTPIDAVTSMVEVHNFLNEGAWSEITTWESIFSRGLRDGWSMCKTGEQNMAVARLKAEINGTADDNPPKLLRFQGRPQDMTPKAFMRQVLGWLYPQKFAIDPPFDRHDWYIQRNNPQGIPKTVRYVIDYYSGDPEPTGEPVFYLDIRPAVDTPTAAAERLLRWSGDVWYRASGGANREASWKILRDPTDSSK